MEQAITEQTGKRYKGAIALGVLAMMVAAGMWGSGAESWWMPAAGGFSFYVAGRFLAWWNHG